MICMGRTKGSVLSYIAVKIYFLAAFFVPKFREKEVFDAGTEL